MTYRCQLKHLTNEELHEHQIACGIALDRAYTHPDAAIRRQKSSLKAKYHRILAEIDKRKVNNILTKIEAE